MTYLNRRELKHTSHDLNIDLGETLRPHGRLVLATYWAVQKDRSGRGPRSDRNFDNPSDLCESVSLNTKYDSDRRRIPTQTDLAHPDKQGNSFHSTLIIGSRDLPSCHELAHVTFSHSPYALTRAEHYRCRPVHDALHRERSLESLKHRCHGFCHDPLCRGLNRTGFCSKLHAL